MAWKYIFLAAFSAALVALSFVIYNIYIGHKESFESEKYYVKGIDISHHNSIINWGMLQEQNLSFAYIKATEGSDHTDRYYDINYDLAKAVGIQLGSYHFYTFARSGREQAAHFIKTAKLASGDLIPAIDFEYSKSNSNTKDTAYVSAVLRELKILENELYEYCGVHPIIYTNKHCYDRYIKDRFDNLIWLSNLDGEPSDDINWVIWQFSHTGKLRGIDGEIDLNYYRGDFQSFRTLVIP